MQSALVANAIRRTSGRARPPGKVIPFKNPKAGDYMRMGAGGACGANGCPPGNPVTPGQMAAMVGRSPVGQAGQCQYSLLPLVNTAVGAGATATITITSQIALCIESIIIVTTGTAGFTFTNLTVGNRPQLVIGAVYHSDLFAPDGDCACCLPGDCLTVGTTVTVSVTNLDAGTARGFFMYLRGPAIY